MTEPGAPMSTPQQVLRFPPTLAGLDTAAAWLRALIGREVNDDARYNLELVFEEVAANIVRHGHPTGDIETAVRFDADEIVLTFEDDGVAFDPGEGPARALPSSLDEARVGGLGLVLLRKIVTRMTYERTAQKRNILSLAIPAR